MKRVALLTGLCLLVTVVHAANASVWDSFRFVILESANPEYPNDAQVSEIELIPAEG